MLEGKFREDLYFRLNVFRIELPPLRALADDVPRLASTFLDHFARELGKSAPALTDEATALLSRYACPGNVRELRNLMERTAVLCRGERVDARFVRSLLPGRSEDSSAGPTATLGDALAAVERQKIIEALEATGGDKAIAARRLGIGERTLWTKLRKHAI